MTTELHAAPPATTAFGSSAPTLSGPPAPDDRRATQGAPVATISLPPPVVQFEPNLFAMLRSSSASRAGYHGVAGFLTCPEQSRLHALGVRRIPWTEASSEPVDLDPLDFGTACHHLRAVRFLHDREWERQLDAWKQQLTGDDHTKMKLMFRTYDAVYPRAADMEQYEFLGVEAAVETDIRSATGEHQLLRSVRYDTVIRDRSGEVWSFEAKFLSRGGQNCVSPYMGQAYAQVALWNANAALTQTYGKMRGVLFDVGLKTLVPNVERYDRVMGRVHHRLAIEYLRTPENMVFYKNADGSYPRMLHACWGRWRPCEYIQLCHEQAYGDYTIKGEPLGGQP